MYGKFGKVWKGRAVAGLFRLSKVTDKPLGRFHCFAEKTQAVWHGRLYDTAATGNIPLR